MSFDDLKGLLQIIKVIFGHEEVRSIGDNPLLLLVVFAIALLTICTALIRRERYGSAVATFALAATMSAAFYGIQRDATRQTTSARHESYELHAGKVLFGGDLPDVSRGLNRTTLGDCQLHCSIDNRCAAFTFDSMQKVCYLKGTVATLHPFGTAVSGIKRRQAPSPKSVAEMPSSL